MSWTQRKTELKKKAATNRKPRPVDRDRQSAENSYETQRRLKNEFYARQREGR